MEVKVALEIAKSIVEKYGDAIITPSAKRDVIATLEAIIAQRGCANIVWREDAEMAPEERRLDDSLTALISEVVFG